MKEKPVQERLKKTKISEVVTPKCVQAKASISVDEAISLMQTNRSGYIILVETGQVAGIFTETDVVRKVLAQKIDRGGPVRELMTSSPHILAPNDSVADAIALMGKHRVYHIPLTDKAGKLAGVLSVRTLIRFLAAFYPKEIYNLPPDPNQIMDTPEGG